MTKKEKEEGPSPLESRVKYNDRGEEIPDPRMIELPLGFDRPKILLADEIRRLISQGVQSELRERGIETFDEADDFNVPDDDMSSPWEENFDSAHLWTRDAEIRAGIVENPSLEQIKLAEDILARHKAKAESKPTAGVSSPASAPAEPAPEAGKAQLQAQEGPK